MSEFKVFEENESVVRGYCRKFPVKFEKAKGSIMYDVAGNEYIDFLCGAGALNYGHNNDYIKDKLIDYLTNDGIMHSLDLYTSAKEEFVKYFSENILKPKGLDYKIQFTSPSGTNAVEAALKLARLNKKRENIFALMGCFHGMSLASLSLTTEKEAREGAGVPLNNVTHIPVPYLFEGLDVINYLDVILSKDHIGIEKPAAIILETVQAEGGIYVFDVEFLKGIRHICDKHDILMIADEIQVGCCRTGEFFSFERAGIIPDMVVMSKSIGGIGQPLAITMFKKELDIWKPGQHNGTFRGNQLAMVSGKAGLEYMLNENVQGQVKQKEKLIKEFLETNLGEFEIRGIGMIWGIDVIDPSIASDIIKECFKNGLILEQAGDDGQVVKILPPLVIEEELLLKGLEIVNNAFKKSFK